MRSRAIWSYIGVWIVAASWWVGGCGGSGSSANVITVSVTSSAGSTLILGQSTTLTATVSGATNTNVNWTPGCQFTTTTVTNSTPTTSTPANCPTDGTLGTLSNELATGTATYTAPGKVPDQTKYPSLQILIVVQSAQNTSKTGKVTLLLDSGISATLTPSTVSEPTKETQSFSVVLTNDLQGQGVTWLLTQQTPTTTNNVTTTYPQLTTCSPACGSIQPQGPTTAIYTAPSTVPTASTPAGASTTPQNVTIVATSKADNTRFAIGTITIIQGGPITFNGITPTIAPQGATLWDIYLDAPNISSASKIILTDQNNGTKQFTSDTGQIKILFPIPTSTTPNPSSTGARLRLLEGDLGVSNATPLTYTVSVTDPAEPVTNASGGQFTFTLRPARPTVVSNTPNSVIQGTTTNVAIDGGYFGPGGTFANVTFQGNTVVPSGGSTSSSRQVSAQFPGAAVGPPGLYPISVSRTTPPLPVPNNPAIASLGVFPDYLTANTATLSTPVSNAGKNPSAIDIDPSLSVAVVAETGSNAVQFYTIGNGSLTPISGGLVQVGQIPTGVSVNRTNHSVAVVNYGSQSVSVLPIPGAPNPVSPATIDLSAVLQGVASPAPLPYAIGVDPDTNLALVAYSSTSVSSAANLGFVVNLNQGANPAFGCINDTSTTKNPGPCVHSQVTLNTGGHPQIAMAPHGHLAFVTPGGSGIVRGVDVTQTSTSVGITTLTLSSGIVTVTTSGTLTGLNPGNPGTVLISGVPGPGTTGNATTANFNGVFPISVTSSNSFNYALNSTASGSASGGTVFYGSSNLNFLGLSQTTQGIAINQITSTAALADANATGLNSGPQINLLNQLDQSVSSITFFADCTAYTTSCVNSAELLGTTEVAWQPYTNALVSYNPQLNQVSISDPVTRQRRAFVCAVASCNPAMITDAQITLPGGVGAGTANLAVQNGTTGSLTLFGGLAVDPATNQAFVVQSGSGTIQVVNLGSIKATQITEVLVPSPNPGLGAIGGIPNALVPQATLTSTNDLAGVQIFGSGFSAGAQVFLDGALIPSANVQVVSTRQLTVTIPAAFLSGPHHYALTVNGTAQSNPADFIVVKAVDMSVACSTGPATPSSVAIADQLKEQPFSPIAVVSNSGCNNISTIDINPLNGTFGQVLKTIAVGTTPQGVAVSAHLGLAVVANNGSNNVSIVNLLNNTQPVSPVTVGTNPTGIAINDSTGAALVANTGSNTVSEINLGLLFGTSPATSLTATTIGGVQEPIAVAIDPDRGTNNQGLAVVTGLQLISGSTPTGALYPVDIGLASPTLSTTVSIGSVTSTPTGIAFNPAVSTGSSHPGLFYVNSSGANVISSFNPDTSGVNSASVGINPTSLAVNPQTGALLTSNFAGKSASIVDTLSSPVKTRKTLGLPGSAQFGVAIDQFTNLAVIVDQANNRVLLFPMPN
jgi:hypothetical protein